MTNVTAHNARPVRPARTLTIFRTVIALLVLAVTASAAAQVYSAKELARMFAIKLDAVYGCERQDIVRAQGDADCFTLEFHSEALARMTIDTFLNSFRDITPRIPWQRDDNGVMRLYGIDNGAVFGLAVGEFGRHVVVVVLALE